MAKNTMGTRMPRKLEQKMAIKSEINGSYSL